MYIILFKVKKVVILVLFFFVLVSCTQHEYKTIKENGTEFWVEGDPEKEKRLEKIISEDTKDETFKKVKKEKICVKSEDVKLYSYMYHYVRDKSWDSGKGGHIPNTVYTENFKVQMKKFKALEEKWDLKTVLASELLEYTDKDCFPNKNIVMFISDDGWDDNYSRLFPIVSEHNLKFNLAIVSGYTKTEDDRYYNFMTEKEVKEVSDSANFEITSHSNSHPDLRTINDSKLQKEICESKDYLENLTWKTITSFVYPAWAYNKKVITKIKECWYKFAFTTKPWFSSISEVKNTPFEIKRIRVWNWSTSDSLVEYFSEEQ